MSGPPRIGDRLPLDVKVWVLQGQEGKRQPMALRLRELLNGKRLSVLVGIPGPFTPGCSRSHVPQFVERSAQLKAKGVEAVFVISTADGAYVCDVTRRRGTARVVLALHRFPGTIINRAVPGKLTINSPRKPQNTAYVMDAFLQSLGPAARDSLVMISDGNLELSRALKLTFDASARGMGMRVQRFALVVDGEGIIKDAQVDAAGAIEKTRAGHLLSRL